MESDKSRRVLPRLPPPSPKFALSHERRGVWDRVPPDRWVTAKAMSEKVATEPELQAEYERCSLCEKAFRSSPVEKRHSRTRSAEPTRLSTFRSSEKFVEVLVGGTVGIRSI